MIVASTHGLQMVASALEGVAPSPSSDWRVRLFKNNDPLTANMTTATFTECEFNGYDQEFTEPQAAGGPTIEDGAAVMFIGNAPFVWDCVSLPETVKGWYLYNADTGNVLFAEEYDEPHVLQVGSRHTLYLKIGVGVCPSS